MSFRRWSALGAACIVLPGCGAETIVDPEPNRPPTVTLTSPVAGSFRGGDTVRVSIAATDAEDGVLAGAVTWWATLHHADHTHPFVPPTNAASGTALIPSAGHLETNIFYRFSAAVEDSEGGVDTTFVDLTPEVVTLSLETIPAGLELVVDGQPRTAPIDVPSVVGVGHVLSATTPQSSGGIEWTFDGWSHGRVAEHSLPTPVVDTTLVATFVQTGVGNASPSVSISDPVSGATVTSGAAVQINADAADADGQVVTVQFRVGTSVLATDSTAPYVATWTPSALGMDTLTARATDDGGATTVSDAVIVTVQAPGGGDVLAPVATLTSPASGTRDLTGAIDLTATATDNVGVVEVEFQVDGETIGTDLSEPYEVTLAATGAYASGAHTLRTRARDAAGNWSEWSVATVTFGGDVALPAGFTRSTFVTGFTGGNLNDLVSAAFSPDGRLFVLERLGLIRVVKNGSLLPAPFASLTVSDGGERGLLGIAFDPDFTTNGYVYVYYTTDEGGTHNRISRFTASGDVAAPGSEVVLVELESVAGQYHNGGAIAFGPDEKLYVAVGDNGNPALAQSLTSRFGKILRYDPDGSIPPDNPLLPSTSGVYGAIWATGLRNPFTFGFHPTTGRMHINDVGQDSWEEVNLGRAGADYGWPATEGPTMDPAYDAPLLAYGHANSPTLYEGFSVVGAAFYAPQNNMFGPAYEGDYFFADYVGGWIYRMDSEDWGVAYAFADVTSGQDLVNLVTGPDGALYVLVGGRVDRIAR